MNSTLMRCLSLQLVDQLEDLALDGHVQRRGRLVGDQQLGLAGQRHRDHHALLLAARHLVRVGMQPPLGLGHADLDEQFLGARQRLLAAQAQVLDQRLDELRADREHRVQRLHRVLEDAGDLLAAQGLQFGQRGLQQVAPCHSTRPLRSALSGSRFRIDIAVTLLPEPDSPTSATMLFSGMSKLTRP